MEDTFDAVVTSEEVGSGKPDQSNFELVLKKFGISQRDNIWMVGDSANTDIYGAKQSGAITFQKLHRGVLLGAGVNCPYYSFASFTELYNLIYRLAS